LKMVPFVALVYYFECLLYKCEMERLVKIKREIVDAITSINDPELQAILELRYLSYHSWEQIAKDLGYGIDNVFKLHRKALERISTMNVIKESV